MLEAEAKLARSLGANRQANLEPKWLRTTKGPLQDLMNFKAFLMNFKGFLINFKGFLMDFKAFLRNFKGFLMHFKVKKPMVFQGFAGPGPSKTIGF